MSVKYYSVDITGKIQHKMSVILRFIKMVIEKNVILFLYVKCKTTEKYFSLELGSRFL